MVEKPYSDLLVLGELERLLASREFVSAGRAARFLRYAVERSLADDRDGLKESVIGKEVFDRRAGYDSKAEPIVRTEARRLRAKLDQFYSYTNDSQVKISIPKGVISPFSRQPFARRPQAPNSRCPYTAGRGS